MQFIAPRYKNKQKVDWQISDHSVAIVKYYAEYTGYSEEEVVDFFLKNILQDQDFIDWINKKTYKKRILKSLFPTRPNEEVDING